MKAVSILFLLILASYAFVLNKLPSADGWNIAKTALEALLCSFIFYFLVVFLPNKRRSLNIKKMALMAYDDFKKEIISHLINMAGLDLKEPENLFSPIAFRKFFSEEKWYQVANSLSGNHLFIREWQLKSRFLRDEILFLLNSVEHIDQKAFESLKILCWRLQELESINLVEDYSDQKILMQFFWQIFAGWHFTCGGYLDCDCIKEKINKY